LSLSRLVVPQGLEPWTT